MAAKKILFTQPVYGIALAIAACPTHIMLIRSMSKEHRGMASHRGPLLAEEGAYLLVMFDQRDRQVIVRTKVCLDLPDRSMSEPQQKQICLTISVAHEHALELAASRSLPVIWEGAEFVASVVYVGGHWQGSWVIRLGAFELESDVTNYRDQHTARSMVKADARNHGYGSRVSWQDDYAETALA